MDLNGYGSQLSFFPCNLEGLMAVRSPRPLIPRALSPVRREERERERAEWRDGPSFSVFRDRNMNRRLYKGIP